MTDSDLEALKALEARLDEHEDRLDDVELQVDNLVRKFVNKTNLTADERKTLKRLQAARARLARRRLENPVQARADVKKAKKAYDRSRKKRR